MPTRTEVDVREQRFALNEELLVILMALAHYTVLKMLDTSTVLVLTEESVFPPSNSPVTLTPNSQQSLAPRQTLPPPRG
jgi:hypothetical protein